MKKICILLAVLSSLVSCVTAQETVYEDDNVVVIEKDNATVSDVIVGAAVASIIYNYIWRWDGMQYYRYRVNPYYAPYPYYYRGPRHSMPRHFRPHRSSTYYRGYRIPHYPPGMPTNPYRNRGTVHHHHSGEYGNIHHGGHGHFGENHRR